MSTVAVISAPEPATYTVVAGDSLYEIADTSCVDLDDLVSVNGWTDGLDHLILPGDVISLPGIACDAPISEPAAPQEDEIDEGAFEGAFNAAFYGTPYGGDPDYLFYLYGSAECTALWESLFFLSVGPTEAYREPLVFDEVSVRGAMADVWDAVRLAYEALPAAEPTVIAAIERMKVHEGNKALAYLLILQAEQTESQQQIHAARSQLLDVYLASDDDRRLVFDKARDVCPPTGDEDNESYAATTTVTTAAP